MGDYDGPMAAPAAAEVGEHRRWRTALRGGRAPLGLGALATAITVVTLVLAWAQKSPCLETYRAPGGGISLEWRNYRQYRLACYSDPVPLYGAEHLDEPGAFPYEVSWIEGQGTSAQRVRHMEYPVLTGLLMWVAAKGAQGYTALVGGAEAHSVTSAAIAFFDILAAVAAACWLYAVWCLRRLTPRRLPFLLLLAAAAPLVIVQAYTNFDMMAVAFATGSMYAWSRGRVSLAGALIGLGTAAKLYPLLLLIPLLVLCLRAGKLAEWRRALLAALLSWEAVNLPILMLFPQGWIEFFRMNSLRGANPETLYSAIMHFTGWGGFDGPLAPNQAPTELNAFIAAVMILVTAAIGVVALSAPRRPRVAQLGFLLVCAFLITNKVWSPQYSLWLLPLALLALPRPRVILVWTLMEAWVWVATMYNLLPEAEGGFGMGPLAITVFVRAAFLLALCARVLYEIYHPERDPVRAGGIDDPAGGVLSDAPDRFRLRARRRLSYAT